MISMVRSNTDASNVPVVFNDDFSGSEMGSNARLKSLRDREDSGEEDWFLMSSITLASDGRSSSVGISRPCLMC